MQEHIYIAQKSRIIKQSFFIWLYVVIQIMINFFIVPRFIQINETWAIIIINLVFFAVTVPGIKLFFKYYKNSIDKTLIVTYESLKFIDNKTKDVIEILNSDIIQIHFVENTRLSRLPWLFHEYFSLTDNKDNKIIITSYIMDISDFWLDPLTNKINKKNMVTEQKKYPTF